MARATEANARLVDFFTEDRRHGVYIPGERPSERRNALYAEIDRHLTRFQFPADQDPKNGTT